MADDHKRVDMKSELGVSRRDLIRRGAIVGGTVLWAAPAIQSINTSVAKALGASNMCATCYCRWRRNNGSFISDRCYTANDNIPPTLVDDASCLAWCRSPDNPDRVAAQNSAPQQFRLNQTQHNWCTGTRCRCVSGMPGPPLATRVQCE